MLNRRTGSERHSPAQNHLLAGLSGTDYDRLRPQMQLVPLQLGKALYEPGSPLRHLYFPVAGVVSLLYTMHDGSTAEIAIIGRDGCVGVAVLLGAVSTLSRPVVQIAGHAYQIETAVILDEFHRGGPLQRLILRYVQSLMTQVSQTAVCNRHHTVEQQLCRWLLLTLDRIASNEVRMTQELISNMLGVRRSGVTQAARTLQEAGLIEYRRGHITVLDRGKLEAHACECYAVVRKETDSLLSYRPA
jgi:CRP-like cAMP-binding protein